MQQATSAERALRRDWQAKIADCNDALFQSRWVGSSSWRALRKEGQVVPVRARVPASTSEGEVLARMHHVQHGLAWGTREGRGALAQRLHADALPEHA